MRKCNLIALFIIALFISVSLLLSGCSSKSKDDKKSLEYANKISIGISLSPSSFLSDMDKDDIIITIVNNGDKTITELVTDVVFYDKNSGDEVGKTGCLIISENKSMQETAVDDKKARWKPLPPGKTLTTGHDVIYFFGGEPELREKVKANWDNLRTTIIIKNIEVR